MLKRFLAPRIRSLAKQFPVVTVTGPRQSGKTTLTRHLFPRHSYVSLEDPNVREFARSDPLRFLDQFRGGVILDEIQRAPQLPSFIQGLVDTDDRPGRFVLTGSQNFLVMSSIGQSLAGRSAVVTLLPFSLGELAGAGKPNPWSLNRKPARLVEKPAVSLETSMFTGFYPRIHDRRVDPQEWLGSYVSTYVERDVREIVNVGNLELFQRFVRLCAGRSGQLLNLSSLAADTGISHPTVRQWISILQASYIIHLLPPHHRSFNKRLTKSPKLYFLDTGLLCYLLRIRDPSELTLHSMRGAIFETFVLAELLKAFGGEGRGGDLYFWRDRTGHEVDVIIDCGERLIPIEIKSASTVSGSFFDGLRYFSTLADPGTVATGVLVHGGVDYLLRTEGLVRPWFSPV